MQNFDLYYLSALVVVLVTAPIAGFFIGVICAHLASGG